MGLENLLQTVRVVGHDAVGTDLDGLLLIWWEYYNRELIFGQVFDKCLMTEQTMTQQIFC